MNSGHTDAEFVEALARERTIVGAAAALNVNRQTVYNRLAKPQVRAMLLAALERAGATMDVVAERLARHIRAQTPEGHDDWGAQHRALDTVLRVLDAYPSAPTTAIQVNTGNPYLASPLADEPDVVVDWAVEHGRLPTPAERQALLASADAPQVIEPIGDAPANANVPEDDGTLP